jgi:hypothetical protein
MGNEKEILKSILNAFCLQSENIKKVCNLAGINSIWNGKRTTNQAVNILIRAISNEKARYIINSMPFPFIEEYSPIEQVTQDTLKHIHKPTRDSFFWIDSVVSPITKKGERIESVITGNATFLR